MLNFNVLYNGTRPPKTDEALVIATNTPYTVRINENTISKMGISYKDINSEEGAYVSVGGIEVPLADGTKAVKNLIFQVPAESRHELRGAKLATLNGSMAGSATFSSSGIWGNLDPKEKKYANWQLTDTYYADENGEPVLLKDGEEAPEGAMLFFALDFVEYEDARIGKKKEKDDNDETASKNSEGTKKGKKGQNGEANAGAATADEVANILG